MHLTVIGTLEDVTGFALAGASGVICQSEADVTAALQAASQDRTVALVAVSERAASLAPAAVGRWRAASGSPVLIVLPDRAASREVGMSGGPR